MHSNRVIFVNLFRLYADFDACSSAVMGKILNPSYQFKYVVEDSFNHSVSSNQQENSQLSKDDIEVTFIDK